ncbi:MAG: hypothetical protein ACQESN_06115 [Thermotogota bacterium]
MVKSAEQNNFVLRIIKPKIKFPEVHLQRGNSIGIYTKKHKTILKNFFKIITNPEKYSEKVTVNELVANNSSWIGRSFSHIVIPELWDKNIVDILKNKPERRHLIVISTDSKTIKPEEFSEISELCSKYKTDGAILTITNSLDLIEATSDEVIDQNGNKISYKTGSFFEDIYTGKEIEDINKIESNIKNIKYKKMKILRDDSTGEFNIDELFKK